MFRYCPELKLKLEFGGNLKITFIISSVNFSMTLILEGIIFLSKSLISPRSSMSNSISLRGFALQESTKFSFLSSSVRTSSSSILIVLPEITFTMQLLHLAFRQLCSRTILFFLAASKIVVSLSHKKDFLFFKVILNTFLFLFKRLDY